MSKYIDAELLKQYLKPSEWGTPDERWIPEHEIGAMLDYFPAADVAEVRHGRWIEASAEDPCYYRCAECGWLSDDEYHYCPNCGAKMTEGDAE